MEARRGGVVPNSGMHAALRELAARFNAFSSGLTRPR
jgi:hypothetical protein